MKTYVASVRDLRETSPYHVNSLSHTLYDQHGLSIALQGNFDVEKRRVQGSSPIHTHHHDELVYLLEGSYGNHNSTGVEQFYPEFLKIRHGVAHGGDSNGVWISVKPNDFHQVGLDLSERTIAYDSGLKSFNMEFMPRHPSFLDSDLSKLEITVEDQDRFLFVYAKSSFGACLMRLNFLR